MIYKFTDTAKRATPGTLPGEALFINGQAIENLIEGYRTLYVKGRESMSAEINLAEQGRADGGGFNYKRYPERVLTIGFQIIAKTNEEYRAKFNALGGILNCEQAELIFNDELDKYFVGTPGEISEIEGGSNKVTGEFNIVCADPFKYSLEEYSAVVAMRYSESATIINYGGTVPTKPRIESSIVHEGDSSDPWGAASYFEFYALNDEVLTFDGGDNENVELVATLDTSTANPSSGGWTSYGVTKTFDQAEQALCEGFFEYETDAPTSCYRLRASLTAETASASPMIEIIRDYANGIPQTELRFKIGDSIVYSEYLDDKNGGKYPFRISYEHAKTTVSLKRGYMVVIVTFQFGDFIFTHKFAETVTASTSDKYDITGASIERARHYMSTGNFTGVGKMSVVNSTEYNLGHPFLYGVPHVVDVENGKLYIDDLFTPYPNNPANNWEGFELKPGQNTARAQTMGIGSGYFKATYYWREKFL